MHSESGLVNTLEYKGDALGETQQEFFIFCSFPACVLMLAQQTSLDSYSQAIFFFPMGTVTSVYPFVAMASALTLLPL